MQQTLDTIIQQYEACLWKVHTREADSVVMRNYGHVLKISMHGDRFALRFETPAGEVTEADRLFEQ